MYRTASSLFALYSLLYTNIVQDPSKSPFIFAHEFFDALPIHAFQSIAPAPPKTSQTLNTPTGPVPLLQPTAASKSPQWRELVVTPASPPSLNSYPAKEDAPPDFQLSLSKASTPPALFLPALSARYKALLPTPGSVIEISPESHSYAADFARRIGGSDSHAKLSNPTSTKSEPSGAALIIDYGPASTIPNSTLRGIRAHTLVSPLSSPGLVDISADVDFTALADAAINASPKVEVHGPMEQGAWLEAMLIRRRAEEICKGIGGEEGKKKVMQAVERLVERGGGGMGRIYKVMAILPEGQGRRPVGFGGDVGE